MPIKPWCNPIISQLPKCAVRKNIPFFFSKHFFKVSKPIGSLLINWQTLSLVLVVTQIDCKAETARILKDFFIIRFFSSGDLLSENMMFKFFNADSFLLFEKRNTKNPRLLPRVTTLLCGRGLTSSKRKETRINSR